MYYDFFSLWLTYKKTCCFPCRRNLFLQCSEDSCPVRWSKVSGAKLVKGTFCRPSWSMVYMATTGERKSVYHSTSPIMVQKIHFYIFESVSTTSCIQFTLWPPGVWNSPEESPWNSGLILYRLTYQYNSVINSAGIYIQWTCVQIVWLIQIYNNCYALLIWVLVYTLCRVSPFIKYSCLGWLQSRLYHHTWFVVQGYSSSGWTCSEMP